MSNDLLQEDDGRMDEYLARAIRRGIQIRRHRRLTAATVAVLAACLAIVPLAISQIRTPPTGQAVDASAFQLVSWRHVRYPGLNFASAAYPVEMGCGPGFPAIFSIDVQQVTYVRPPGVPDTLAVVLVKCESSTPTPSSLYAFAPGANARTPRLLQVLLAPPNPRVDVLWYATHFFVRGHTVSLPAKGVSDNNAVCCRSVSTTMQWSIRGEHFVRQDVPVHNLAHG